MKKPMDVMLDRVKWELMPPLEDIEAGLYATHQGILDFGAGITMKCYQLNDGQRVIDSDDLKEFLGLSEISQITDI